MRYRKERYWISNSFLLFWDKFIGVVFLLHKDGTVGRSPAKPNSLKFMTAALLISFSRLYWAARAALCVGVQTGLQMKCWCVTELWQWQYSSATSVGRSSTLCGLYSLADLASTWYRWVQDGLSEGLWEKIQTSNWLEYCFSSFWSWTRPDKGGRKYSCYPYFSRSHRQECHATSCWSCRWWCSLSKWKTK